MKIKKVSCTQFAGIRDREVTFTDGINIVCGKNESGKSTMVNLIGRTLFQKAKLDRRSDREFCERYFPSSRRDGDTAGDFADGKITFETEKGDYTLSKEWGSDSRCTLSTPSGVIKDQKKIDEILKETLLYGEGVYADLLLTSQHNIHAALQTILDASQKTAAKKEITEAVSQAFVESDGISVDAIEQAIQAKIEGIAGKHWDFDREAPSRKNGRWASGLGEILKAYYAMEDANAVLAEISRLESAADIATSNFAEIERAANIAADMYDKLSVFSNELIIRAERNQNIAHMEKELQRLHSVLAEWPVLEEEFMHAQALQTEQNHCEVFQQYAAAKKLTDEICALEQNEAVPCPTSEDIRQAKVAQRTISALENSLCGMNLAATIRMLGNNTVCVTSLRTGLPIEISEENVTITEAVAIAIPGVMEMQLAPADVDVINVEKQIQENQKILSGIFSKFAASCVEDLEQQLNKMAGVKTKLDTARRILSMLLGETSFESLEKAAATLPSTIRTKLEIEQDILHLCGNGDVARFAAAKETVLNGYQQEYGSIHEVEIRALDLDSDLAKAKAALSVTEDISQEYPEISDMEQYLKNLQEDVKRKQALQKDALAEKTSAVSRLESYKEHLSGDPVVSAETAEHGFLEQKQALAHWLHIAQVFQEQKENLHANPMQDIADSFSRYLGVISGGKVFSEFPEGDKLSMDVYSGDALLNYDKLSEGTKETVSLAFRLAVLDHLFTDGGGTIVLDDPFADMDAERAKQACTLIRECAKRHQVIFLTCHEAYADMLQGNAIWM